MELKVSGDFTILPSQNADIRAQTPGVIEEIPVDEGDEVPAGDPPGLHERTVGAGEAVGKNEERLKYGRAAYRRLQALLGEGLASRKEVEEGAEQVAVRRKELDESRSGLKMATKEIAADEAAVARLEAQRDCLEDQIRLARLVAPHAGVVTTPRLKEKIGHYVEKGDLIAEVHKLRTVSAEIEVPEKEIADVRAGQRVLLKARALPGRTFSGTVTAIAPAVAPAGEQAWLKVVRVTTTLDNADRILKSVMRGTAPPRDLRPAELSA